MITRKKFFITIHLFILQVIQMSKCVNKDLLTEINRKQRGGKQLLKAF